MAEGAPPPFSDRIQLGDAQQQPFDASGTEVDLDSRIRTRPFGCHDHPLPEFGMSDKLPDPKSSQILTA